MKEILTVIRMNQINATKAALVAAGFPSFTACRVMGRGSRPVDFAVVAAATAEEPVPEAVASLSATPRLMAKRMLSVVVPDGAVGRVVQTIIQANRTGRPGDGKIFVLPVGDAARVRTGETGARAVSEMSAE